MTEKPKSTRVFAFDGYKAPAAAPPVTSVTKGYSAPGVGKASGNPPTTGSAVKPK